MSKAAASPSAGTSRRALAAMEHYVKLEKRFANHQWLMRPLSGLGKLGEGQNFLLSQPRMGLHFNPSRAKPTNMESTSTVKSAFSTRRVDFQLFSVHFAISASMSLSRVQMLKGHPYVATRLSMEEIIRDYGTKSMRAL